MTISRLLCCFALAATAAHSGRADSPYHFIKEISVGGEGAWDYLTIDSAAHRLYLSHGNVAVVLDTETDKVIGQIEGTLGIHGVAIAPKLGRGFTSNGRENKVSVFDLETLKTLFKVETGANPDWIMFEPTQGEIYTFNGRGKSATVIAAETGKVVATIELGGKPETAMADATLGRIYVNIEDTNEVVAIDMKKHEVVARWPIAPHKAATGMAIDLAHKRLFLGCGESNTMAMMDYTTGKIVASVPTGSGVDACSFDPSTQLAFSSAGGSGTVTIAHVDTPEKMTLEQTLTTEVRARTMTADPATHKIYLTSAKFVTAAGASPTAKARPAMIPGTFRVLVYGLGN